MNNNSSSKSLRDLSFKPRFRHNYGSDSEYYNYILKYKEQWEDKLFYIDEALVEDEFKNDDKYKGFKRINSGNLNIPDIKLKSIGESQLQTEFNLSQESLKVLLNMNNKETFLDLKFGQSIKLNDAISRNGLLLNTGGHITSMKWLINSQSKGSSRIQYLAISVINSVSGTENSINCEELSSFNSNGNNSLIKSGIQIWQYDTLENSFSLVKFYLTTNLGSTTDLQWLPIEVEDDENLTILSGSFGGRLHIFKIHLFMNSVPELAIMESSSISYQVTDHESKKSDEIIGISCYAFLGTDKIIVGLNNGSIAEFVLPFYSLEDSDEGLDIHIPSFIEKVGNSPISTIMIAEPESNKFVLVINTSGIQSVAFEYGQFQHFRLEAFATTSNIKPSYNPSLKMYIGSYASDSISFNFIKGPQEAPNSLIKVDGIITAIKSSEVLGHPLSLIGNTFGEVHLVNYSRKFLNGAKATNKTLIPLRIWNIGLENDILKVSGDLEVVSSEKSSEIAITPPEILISSLAWNENVSGSSIYTVGSISGLVVLERLDPKFYN